MELIYIIHLAEAGEAGVNVIQLAEASEAGVNIIHLGEAGVNGDGGNGANEIHLAAHDLAKLDLRYAAGVRRVKSPADMAIGHDKDDDDEGGDGDGKRQQ